MLSIISDKQFILGFSVGMIFSVIYGFWKQKGICPETVEHCVSTRSKSKNKAKKSKEFKMVIVVRKDNKVTKRELAVQCVCACLEAFKISQHANPDYVERWKYWGQMKVALKVNSEAELLSVKTEADNNNLVNYLYRDLDSSKNNATVLAIGPDSVDDINKVTGHLKLL